MVENRKMQYLYAQGDQHVFMDMESYEQTTLSAAQIENELKYLTRKYGSSHSNITKVKC